MKLTVSATPSLNKFSKFNGWRIILNWKKKYHRQLKNYYLLKLKKKIKIVMKIQRFGNRILDVDNYYGGCKPLIDCIKELGLIVDDRPEWCDIIFLPQEKCARSEEKTVVEIIKEKKNG